MVSSRNTNSRLKHGTNAAYAVLDSLGHIAAEDTYKEFTPETVRQVREYIKRQAGSFL